MVWIADVIFGSVLNEITKAAIILVLMAFIANQFYLIYRMSRNKDQKKVDEESIKVGSVKLSVGKLGVLKNGW